MCRAYPIDGFRVCVFVSLLVSLYVVAARHVWRLVGERAGRCPPLSGRPLATRRITLAVSFCGLLCIGYGFCIEPNWLEVTHVLLPTSKLPRGTGPLRIVQVSDVHCDDWSRPIEQKAIEEIGRIKPDLILFTGDAVNDLRSMPIARRWLRALAAIAPAYSVMGNWDVLVAETENVFNGTGVTELNAQGRMIHIKGADVWVGGIAAFCQVLLPEFLRHVPANAYTIFMAHYPDYVSDVCDHGIDLYCAGHTHGGQVALPWYGALMTLTRSGKKYEAGLFQVGQMRLYVNRGIGTHTIRARFLARPEITVFDIVPAN